MNPNRDQRSATLPVISIHQNTSCTSSSSGRAPRTDDQEPDTTDNDPSAQSDSRMLLKSNWFMLFTRRKRQPSGGSDADRTSLEQNAMNEDETTGSNKSFGEYSGGRHRKNSILYVFNKCLMFGSKDTRRSTSMPANMASAAAQQDVGISIETRMDICTKTTDPQENCMIASEPTPDSIVVWLNSLSQEEAKIYRAKIAMNPLGWYRGGMSRDVAQKKLQGQPNGSFLVRDSQTSGCHFTLSFRSAGITLHYRIENTDGMWIIESCHFESMVCLINHAQHLSQGQILCYVKPSSQLQQPFPVRLTNPISKFDEVPSLQHICRYVSRLHIPDTALGNLPIKMREYIRQKPFLGRHIGYFET